MDIDNNIDKMMINYVIPKNVLGRLCLGHNGENTLKDFFVKMRMFKKIDVNIVGGRLKLIQKFMGLNS